MLVNNLILKNKQPNKSGTGCNDRDISWDKIAFCLELTRCVTHWIEYGQHLWISDAGNVTELNVLGWYSPFNNNNLAPIQGQKTLCGSFGIHRGDF